jgi:hypothetical protein
MNIAALVVYGICVLLVVGWTVAAVRGARECTGARAAVEAALGRFGVALHGNLFEGSSALAGDASLRGHVPVPFKLGSAMPDAAPDFKSCAVLEFPLAVADVVVCDRQVAPAVFGPFPPSATSAGHPIFDAAFGVFFHAPDATAYRGTMDALSATWAAPPVLQRALDVGFVGMQVTGGQARLAVRTRAQAAAEAPATRLVDAWGLARMMQQSAARAPFDAPAPIPDVPAPPPVMIWLLGVIVLGFGAGWSPNVVGLGAAACPNGGTWRMGGKNQSNQCVLVEGHTRREPRSSYNADNGPATALVVALVVTSIPLILWGISRSRARVLRALAKHLTPAD